MLFMPNGDVITILHAQRTYRRQTASELKQAREAMKGAGIQLPVPKVSEVVDGKQEKAIDGRKAHLYVVKLADGKSQIEEWTSTDFPDIDVVRRVMYCVAEQGDLLRTGFGASLRQKLPGITVETRARINGPETGARFKSLSAKPIADEAYVIPAGYTELAMPFSGGVPAPVARPPK